MKCNSFGTRLPRPFVEMLMPRCDHNLALLCKDYYRALLQEVHALVCYESQALRWNSRLSVPRPRTLSELWASRQLQRSLSDFRDLEDWWEQCAYQNPDWSQRIMHRELGRAWSRVRLQRWRYLKHYYAVPMSLKQMSSLQ